MQLISHLKSHERKREFHPTHTLNSPAWGSRPTPDNAFHQVCKVMFHNIKCISIIFYSLYEISMYLIPFLELISCDPGSNLYRMWLSKATEYSSIPPMAMGRFPNSIAVSNLSICINNTNYISIFWLITGTRNGFLLQPLTTVRGIIQNLN